MPEITIFSDEKTVPQTEKAKLRQCVRNNDWGTVVNIYEGCRGAQTAKIHDSLGTALHVAVKLNEEQVVNELVSAITRMPGPNPTVPLEIGNELGNTPLHVAASKGFERICRCIVGEGKERLSLTKLKNKEGETPLFLAAFKWNKYAFAYLNLISKDIVTIDDLVRDNGDSILHCAIKNEDFDLALIIMHCYGRLLCTHTNDEGYTPLKALADTPSAFKSGSGISGWQLILYHWTLVGPLVPENAMDWLLRMADPPEAHFPMNYATLRDFFKLLTSVSLVGPDDPFQAQGDYSKDCDYTAGIRLPSNYATMQQFVSTTVGCIFGIFRVAIPKTHLEEVTMKKKKNQWSGQLLKELMVMERPDEAFTGTEPAGLSDKLEPDMDHLCYQCDQVYNQRNQGETSRCIELVQDESKPDVREETAFVIAARKGVVEMVEEILSEKPNAINDTNSKNENVLLLAARNRHALVVEALKNRVKNSKPEIWNDLIDRAVDGERNTILHLAAMGLEEDQPGQIAGSALQMMWDTKWFQYIMDEVPRHYNVICNNNRKTAMEIFKAEHKELIKDSSTWLKDTSESCSVVAALIAGVSFATACTVPGGTDKGDVPLQGKPAFNAFAISSLVGLCFSVTALSMFLSILTSRKEAKDFRTSLPLKLLLGLSSLFLSTVAMFVSFCSGHFFLINKTYKKFIFPLYGASAFPLLFFAIAQFPLYYDLLMITLMQVPKGKGLGHSL